MVVNLNLYNFRDFTNATPFFFIKIFLKLFLFVSFRRFSALSAPSFWGLYCVWTIKINSKKKTKKKKRFFFVFLFLTNSVLIFFWLFSGGGGGTVWIAFCSFSWRTATSCYCLGPCWAVWGFDGELSGMFLEYFRNVLGNFWGRFGTFLSLVSFFRTFCNLARGFLRNFGVLLGHILGLFGWIWLEHILGPLKHVGNWGRRSFWDLFGIIVRAVFVFFL